MKNYLILVFVSLILFSSMSISSLAQVATTDCFSYYNFQNGLLFNNFHTQKTVLNAGDDAIVNFAVTSNMKAPIVQGSVLVRILYENNGIEYPVDEFIAAKDINLLFNSSVDETFTWHIPSDAKPGTYAIKSFFIVANKFNLAGINFIDSIPGSVTTFTVQNAGNYNFVHFDRSTTTINGKGYDFVGFTSAEQPNTPLTINTGVIDESSGSGNEALVLTIKTYKWDDSNPANEITSLSRTSSLTFGPGVEQNIPYQINGLAPDAYLVVYTLKTHDGQTVALLKLRLSISGANAIFNYLGMDSFPLTPNQQVTGFFCVSNGADFVTQLNGTGYVEISDEQGNLIANNSFGPIGIIPSPPQGWSFQFTPSKSYPKLIERAFVYGTDGTLMDTAQVVYDISKFSGLTRELSISAGSSAPGSSLPFNVNYQDSSGTPLSGQVMVYLNDNSGNLISSQNITVSESGSYQGNVQVPSSISPGTYTLKALDLQFNIANSVDVQINQTFNSSFLTIVLAVAAIVVVIVLLKITRKI